MKLIMMKGLPGSGKSTIAKEMVNNHGYKRVNRDELRKMIDTDHWSQEREKFIRKIRDEIVLNGLLDGHTVIVDDTNLRPQDETHFRSLATSCNVDFEIVDLSEVPVDVCIRNDLKRTASVGSKVINKMYYKYLHKPRVIEHNPELHDVIICDLDGTLALFDGNPYERDFSQDKVNEPIKNIVNTYYDAGNAEIILFSGRNGKFELQTREWLKQNKIEYDQLYMRSEDDKRKDFIVKQEMFNAHIKNKYNVLFVLDDRNQVVDLWRSLGLTCLQVNYGDF